MRLHVYSISRNSGPRQGGSVARRHRRRLAPGLELLEDRLVLSTWTVTSAADSGSGSLRATIAKAGSGDTIRFASGLFGQTIHLTSGELEIGQNLTIQGPGAGLLERRCRWFQPGLRHHKCAGDCADLGALDQRRQRRSRCRHPRSRRRAHTHRRPVDQQPSRGCQCG